MKIVVTALIACAAGVVAGYVARTALIEERVQTNLSRLGGESLAQLDQLSALTHGFKKEEVDAVWTEWKRVERDYPSPESLEYASTAFHDALIYREVERVGWPKYRDLIRQNSQEFLGWRPSMEKLGQKITSPVLLKRIEAAESQIFQTFPEMKERPANEAAQSTTPAVTPPAGQEARQP